MTERRGTTSCWSETPCERQLHRHRRDCRPPHHRRHVGATTIGVNLIEPNTVFLDYREQLDLRVARTFRFDRYRIQRAFAPFFSLPA